MTLYIDNLSDDPSEALPDVIDLCRLWEKWEPFISVSVVHLESEAVTDGVTILVAYAKANDKTEFNASKVKLKNAVRHIRFSGILSLETIL